MQIKMKIGWGMWYHSYYKIVFNILFITCALIDGISYFITPLKVFDECLALLIVPLFLYALYRNNYVYHFSGRLLVFAGVLAVFMAFGMFSTMKNGYQPLKNAIKDAYVLVKFFFAIGVGYLMFEKADLDGVIRDAFYYVYLITIALFGMCLVDLVFHVFPGGSRMGLRAVSLIYTTYSSLAAAGIFISAVWIREYQYYKWKVLPGLAMIWFVVFCTLRLKAIVMIMISGFLVLFICMMRRKPGIVLWGIMAAGAFAMAARQFAYYFVNMADESARALLTHFSFRIASDYFPLGTGWGTYGSAFSVDPYSKVYYLYHLNKVWGLSPKYNAFVSDTFWPMILGENGYFGLVLYALMILILFWEIYKWAKTNAYVFCSGLVCMLYLLISSTSESAFVNSIAVPFAFWLGILFADISQQKKRNKIRKEYS